MIFGDLENEEIATLVAYSIASDCEKGKRRFEEEYGKEAPQSRTIRNWCKKFKETLSLLPKSKANLQHPNEIEEEKKMEVVTAFGDGVCSSQREASRSFGIAQSSVCKILKEKGFKAFRYNLFNYFCVYKNTVISILDIKKCNNLRIMIDQKG